ncbi:DUF308 domain-containing protein [Seohaeicola saemankumensis]|nr:DUF308 domain-containing protein [Seohaeicola saemankumensis]MCA0873098.1 DUF308 domain-containing protein [Seohaeicola saemankumensis]
MTSWIKWVLLGVLSVACGIFVLNNPIAASIAVTTLAGILFVVMGVFQVFAGFGNEGGWGKLMGIGLGVLMVLLGGSLLSQPLVGVLTLTYAVVILFAANGVARLITGFQMKQTPFFWPMVLSGALSIALSIYIIANFAAVALPLLGFLVGIELLFNGISLVILGFFVRSHGEDATA